MNRVFKLLIVAALACSVESYAQTDFPSRAVRIVIGQTPGGPTDIPARMLAQRLSERTGQAFVVENRPGGASNIGTEIVARAAKDAYTLLMASPQHVTNPYLFTSLPFDPVRDFMPVSLAELPELIRSRKIRIDVALLQVSPPDRHGYSSLGVSVDIVRSAAGDFGMETIYRKGIGQLQRQEFEARLQKRYFERFQWPLGIALALLALESFVPDRRRSA